MLKERESDCNGSSGGTGPGPGVVVPGAGPGASAGPPVMMGGMGTVQPPSAHHETGIGGGVGVGTAESAAVCAGCGGKIVDRYYLLAVDRQWHSACLKCCECKLPLDSELTCFAREGNIYCKEDYYRLFAVKRCARCQAGITANELVMRARELVYHLACFACVSCHRLLTKGDQFGMRDHLIYCKSHYEMLLQSDYCGAEDDPFRPAAPSPNSADSRLGPFFNGVGAVQKGRPRKRKVVEPDLAVAIRGMASGLEIMHHGEIAPHMDQMGYDSGTATPPNQNHQPQRTKRMRTSFKHHQLRTMKSYFNINQNPDAKDLKQLAQKTGLSKRVLQVWFQNARAKWRRNMLRQENQSQPSQATKSDEEGLVGGPIPQLPSAHAHMDLSTEAPPPATEEHTPPQSLAFGELY